MLVAFTLWCIKRYGSSRLKGVANQVSFKLSKCFKNIFFLVLMFTCYKTKAQEVQRTFHIIRGDDIIGKMTLKRIIKADTVYYTMNSYFKTIFIFPCSASTTEESVFQKGVLVNSSFYRLTNGKVNCDNKVRWNGSKYEAYKNNKTTTLTENRIVLNMITLMFSKPMNLTQVFSDRLQVFVKLKKLSDDQFTIHFPDNTENIYKYQGDLCSQLEIKSSMFNVKIVLVS